MLVLAGGVAANSRLRQLITEKMQAYPDVQLVIPPMYCCTDNAAMIGAVGLCSISTWTSLETSLQQQIQDS